MEIYLTWIVAFFLTLILTILFTVLFTKIKGNLYENIRGGIPRAVGIAPFIVLVLFLPKPYNYLVAFIGITAFFDDVVGRKKVTPYLDLGQISRGLGILLVMISGYYLMGPVAILIALFVQIFNIADMQPGTACTTIIIASVFSFAVLAMMGSSLYYLPILLLLICLAYASQDYSGYIMMGEVGNHSFGVSVGICLAIVSALLAKMIAPTVFYPVEFIIMLIFFIITAVIIAKLRETTLTYYLETYLNIENPSFGDFLIDVLTGGGLGDLFRRIFLGTKQYTVNGILFNILGGRRLLYNPYATKVNQNVSEITSLKRNE